VAEEHQDPESLLLLVTEAEAKTARVTGQLNAILEEALLR